MTTPNRHPPNPKMRTCAPIAIAVNPSVKSAARGNI